MKYLLLLIILQYPLFSFPQECDYEENKTDEFTKKKVIRLAESRIFSKRSWSNQFIDIKLIRNGEFKYLYLTLTEVGGSRLSCFKTGDILYLKQQNDSIVKLHNLSIECGNYQSMPQGYYYILSFNLNSEDIEALKLSPIVKIRINIIEGEIKKNATNYFINNLNCLD